MVEFDVQIQVVAHDGAPGHIELFGHFIAVWIRLFPDEVMKPHHPFPRWAVEGLRIEWLAGAHSQHDAGATQGIGPQGGAGSLGKKREKDQNKNDYP